MPLVIAIDEPNSFLYPKAVRSLLQILNVLPIKHQYVITTHSPEVIRSASANTITVASNDHGITRITKLSPRKLEDIKVGLASIGVRLSDLYGADKILWVEGETEELAFPLIADRIAKIDSIGTAIIKVNATGDFESPKKIRPRMVFETYKNLSSSGAIIPPAIGFIFDRETRNETDIAGLVAESSGSVTFLDRLCFENYILHPQAIAIILTATSKQDVTSNQIMEWVSTNGADKKYLKEKAADGQEITPWSSEWLSKVHAPKLLSDVFSNIPEQPEEYRKTTHSLKIAEWIIENDPDHLLPLSDLIRQALQRSHNS